MQDNTRDIAIRANSKVDQHMTDCTAFRETIQTAITEIRADLKQLNWRMAFIIGGFTLAGKFADYLFSVHK